MRCFFNDSHFRICVFPNSRILLFPHYSYPIAIEQSAGIAPTVYGLFLGIVIVRRLMDGQAFAEVAAIFVVERERFVFQMARDEELATAVGEG